MPDLPPTTGGTSADLLPPNEPEEGFPVLEILLPNEGVPAANASADKVYAYASSDGGGSKQAKARAVRTKAKRIQRAQKSLNLTMPGTLAVIAGMKLTLDQTFRAGVSGDWKIISVAHTLDRSGWITTLEGEGF